MKRLLTVAVLAAAVLMLGSCDLFLPAQTPEQTLDMFFSDAQNANFSNMYTKLHPDMASYNALKDPNQFDTIYEGGYGLTWSATEQSDGSYLVAINYPTSHVKQETFTFKAESTFSNVYLIRTFTVTSGTVVTYN